MAAALQAHVRPARDADAKHVVALLESAGLAAAFDPSEFLIGEENGKIVGCARLRTFASGAHEIASVAVAADRRGTRLGTQLVEATLARATGPVYALALAPGFFLKRGFRPLLIVPPELEEKARTQCGGARATAMLWTPDAETAEREIKRRYAAAAESEACCNSGCCETGAYSAEELATIPEGAYLQLGTGNPVREAKLAEGEVVLDLGSGAGVDVLLAARVVGPKGRAIGVDFTPEMVAKARANVKASGLSNVEIHEAPMERTPLPDASVDVVVSNCVVNLSLNKAGVLAEARRVLRPGGRLVVSDTLRLEGVAPSAVPSCDCTTGALSAEEWTRLLTDAGFEDILLERGPTRGVVGTTLVRARAPTTGR